MSPFSKKHDSSSKKKPSLKQWFQFFKVLDKKEKRVFFFLLILFLFSAFYLFNSFYAAHSNVVPAEYGSLKEGLLGQPQFVNPLYAISSDIDRDLTELVFSSLMTYDNEANIVPDLIQEYKIEENGRTIAFTLKENIKWHDGQKLTIDDVIFTINLVQDPNYLSPLRANWQGIGVEKLTDYKGLFKLKQPYSGFMENLASLKIMPKHIWQNIAIPSFTSNKELNLLSPVGSGPYIVQKVEQKNDLVKSITLKANNNYYDGKPKVKEIVFVFFDKKEDLYNSLKKGSIDLALIDNSAEYSNNSFPYSNWQQIKTSSYFSAFLNNEKSLFQNKEIRKALDLAINKQEVMEKAIENKGYLALSPIIPSFYGFEEPSAEFDLEQAKSILSKQGFEDKEGVLTKTIKKTTGFEFKKTLDSGSKGTDVTKLQECLADEGFFEANAINGNFGDQTKQAVISFQEKYKDDILVPSGLDKGSGRVAGNTIKKLNEICFKVPDDEIKLSFNIKTADHPALIAAANNLKEQWEKLGAKISVEKLENGDIKKVIRERSFEVLLFGEKLGAIADPLPFWHSSQIIDPGLNISVYQNTKADELLEKSRLYYNYIGEERISDLEDFQDIVLEDSPAVFLYSPDLIYATNKSLKGFSLEKIVDPSKRFVDIENWYLKTKRVWAY